jgi:hypothetical protein
VLRCPVTLAVRSHPAVVAFAHHHGVSVRARPIWNVGEEWGERVVSTDPLVIRVTLDLGGETLTLFVGRDLTVGWKTRTDRDTDPAETTAAETDSATA